MAEPHASSNPSQSHRTADQPPLANGQAPGGPEAAGGDGRIASLSSQLKGLAADVGKSPQGGADASAKGNPESPQGQDTGREEDWGIAPPRAGMSRETKMGFAFVFVLMVVFGFVVYKKVEHNRAERGELLAAAQADAAEKNKAEPKANPGNTLENPIAENAFPPVQNDPFPEQKQPAPAEFTPASFNPESFPTPPQQQLASFPSHAGTSSSASIDQFPAETGQQFNPPEATAASQPFPPEPEFQPAPESQGAKQPTEFNANPFPQTEVARSPVPPGVEQPAEFANPNELPAQKTAAAPPAETGEFNPFARGNLPAQSEPAPAFHELENEQFSAQSQPIPQTTAQAPPAGNPFGELPDSQGGQPGIEELQTVQSTPQAAAGDPFAASSAFEPTPKAEDPVASNHGANAARSPGADEFNPLAQAAPVPVPVQNDPRFGDFQPAPTGNQYEPNPSGVPNELPSDLFTQLSATQLAGGLTSAHGQMQPTDRPEVYIVHPGDNYWNISKKQYGTVRYFTALARYNQQRIPDPKKMRPGMKVLTPTRDVLESRNPDLFPRFAANTGGIANAGLPSAANAGFFLNAGGGPMYRVGPQDTLGGIAQKHLGRFSRWVEIYQLNRHRLKDPNALTLGDELQLPADASRVNMVQQASGIR